jgi:hypothetical protein
MKSIKNFVYTSLFLGALILPSISCKGEPNKGPIELEALTIKAGWKSYEVTREKSFIDSCETYGETLYIIESVNSEGKSDVHSACCMGPKGRCYFLPKDAEVKSENTISN